MLWKLSARAARQHQTLDLRWFNVCRQAGCGNRSFSESLSGCSHVIAGPAGPSGPPRALDLYVWQLPANLPDQYLPSWSVTGTRRDDGRLRYIKPPADSINATARRCLSGGPTSDDVGPALRQRLLLAGFLPKRRWSVQIGLLAERDMERYQPI